MKVISKPNTVSVILQNLENTASELYPDNAAPTTAIPAGSLISPSGFQGTSGTLSGAAGGDLKGTYPNPTLNKAEAKGMLIAGDGTDAQELSVGTNGQVLHARSTQALGLQYSAIDLTGVLTTLSGALPIGNGGTGATAFTAGSIVFAGASALAQDNANLFWDNTNNRLGLGTTSPTAVLHIKAGTATANTAPLKFTSGSLLTTAEAGAVEFLTDKAYLTITTGAARKELTLNDAALVSGRVPYATTNGRLTSHANLTFDGADLTVGGNLDLVGKLGVGETSPTALLHIKAGTTVANTAPLKFTSGSLLTLPEAGAVEFLTDKAYLTITTSAARKELTLNDIALTSGRIPFVTTNGRLTDSSALTVSGGTITATSYALGSGSATINSSGEGIFSAITTTGSGAATIGGALAVSGTVTISQGLTALSLSNTDGTGVISNAGFATLAGVTTSGIVDAGLYEVSGTQVVSTRRTGWTAATGTATRTTFDTSTVSLTELAQAVKALLDDLIAHGLIGT